MGILSRRTLYFYMLLQYTWGLQFVAHASSSSLHTVFFVIRMKLTLCVIVLCSYLTLSVARTIPDRNDWENDADRTSHDFFPNLPPLPAPEPVYDPADPMGPHVVALSNRDENADQTSHDFFPNLPPLPDPEPLYDPADPMGPHVVALSNR